VFAEDSRRDDDDEPAAMLCPNPRCKIWLFGPDATSADRCPWCGQPLDLFRPTQDRAEA